jgi:hypothetical protein
MYSKVLTLYCFKKVVLYIVHMLHSWSALHLAFIPQKVASHRFSECISKIELQYGLQYAIEQIPYEWET